MEIAKLYEIYSQYPSVKTDTRKLEAGDLFFALKGPNFNGNEFAAGALEAGASYAVVDEAKYATNSRYILVDNVLNSLQQLALFHRQQFNIPFIAITGSNGKTTTKELITTVLRKKYVTYATEGNLNNHIGVPLTILKIRNDAQMAIIEMGANHLKEIEGYCTIALPTHAIITNSGKAHIEGFGSEEGVRKGKGELYDFIRANGGMVFRNADLDYLKDMASGIAEQVTYGTQNAIYRGEILQDEVFLNLNLRSEPDIHIKTKLVGDYNFPNVMAAIAIGGHFDVPLNDIADAIEDYTPGNSRSQWIQKGDNKIILDAYNANPTSMRAAISNFAAAGLPNKILWLGAMKEMGVEEQKEHESLVLLIDQYQWKEVILVGKEYNRIPVAYKKFETSSDAAAYVKNNLPHSSSILIKGSRGSKMEVLLDVLPGLY